MGEVLKRSEAIERALAIAAGKVVELRPEKLKPSKPKGITVADVLAVFPGAKAILPTVEDLTKPHKCEHCNGGSKDKKQKGDNNKHARIVKRTWPNGKWDWMCHACGSAAQKTKNKRTPGFQPERVARDDLSVMKALEGKRGGVFCRGCFCPMAFEAVGGGFYGWRCEPCGITWRVEGFGKTVEL